jgi:nitrate reductase cytochrome c-type subunit
MFLVKNYLTAKTIAPITMATSVVASRRVRYLNLQPSSRKAGTAGIASRTNTTTTARSFVAHAPILPHQVQKRELDSENSRPLEIKRPSLKEMNEFKGEARYEFTAQTLAPASPSAA